MPAWPDKFLQGLKVLDFLEDGPIAHFTSAAIEARVQTYLNKIAAGGEQPRDGKKLTNDDENLPTTPQNSRAA